MTDSENKPVKEQVDTILKDQYHPLMCMARNAISLQQIADKKVNATISIDADGNIQIMDNQVRSAVKSITEANNMMNKLIEHVGEGKVNPLNDLVEALRASSFIPDVSE